MIYPFGVFALAISHDLGWPRQAVASMIGPALLVTIFAQPMVGWIVNRFDKRTVSLCALAGLAIGVAGLACAPAQEGAFAALLFVAVALGCVATPTVYSALLSEMFDARRGLVLGVSTAFTGLGIATIPPFIAAVSGAYGWRTGYWFLAAAGAVAVLVNALLLRGARPAIQALSSEPTSARDAVLAAMRERRFWTLAAIYFCLAVAANAVPVHLPIILKERGASASVGALSLTTLGLTMILGRPIIGHLTDRLPIRWVLSLMILGPLAGSLALAFTAGTGAALLAATGFGLAIGGEFVCLGYMVSRAYGLRNFGVVYGWIAVALAAGVAAGPIAISALLALGHGYGPPLLMVGGISLVALALTFTLLDSDYRKTRLQHTHQDAAGLQVP